MRAEAEAQESGLADAAMTEAAVAQAVEGAPEIAKAGPQMTVAVTPPGVDAEAQTSICLGAEVYIPGSPTELHKDTEPLEMEHPPLDEQLKEMCALIQANQRVEMSQRGLFFREILQLVPRDDQDCGSIHEIFVGDVGISVRLGLHEPFAHGFRQSSNLNPAIFSPSALQKQVCVPKNSCQTVVFQDPGCFSKTGILHLAVGVKNRDLVGRL